MNTTPKQRVLDFVGRLSDALTTREIAQEVAILADIDDSEAEVAEGKFVEHEELFRRLRDRAKQCRTT